MKGPFGLLLIGGGIILIVGLFTGKITFPGAAPSSASAPGGVAIPGQPCPPGYSNIAGICQPNPHKCPSGQVWLSAANKCVPISVN